MISMHFRCPQSLIVRLDELAEERGLERSRLVRQLLEAAVRDRPSPVTEPLTQDELIAILTERARNGHVAAARALLSRVEKQSPRSG